MLPFLSPLFPYCCPIYCLSRTARGLSPGGPVQCLIFFRTVRDCPSGPALCPVLIYARDAKTAHDQCRFRPAILSTGSRPDPVRFFGSLIVQPGIHVNRFVDARLHDIQGVTADALRRDAAGRIEKQCLQGGRPPLRGLMRLVLQSYICRCSGKTTRRTGISPLLNIPQWAGFLVEKGLQSRGNPAEKVCRRTKNRRPLPFTEAPAVIPAISAFHRVISKQRKDTPVPGRRQLPCCHGRGSTRRR